MFPVLLVHNLPGDRIEELDTVRYRTGITEYLRNGGELETAARIAGHDSTRTTQIYDQFEQELTLDEIERILI